MTEGAPLLELRNVSKAFGAVQALSGVNLIVEAGKVTSLAGDNGAGKSVTIKTIAGLWEPSGGEILWEGQPVHIHSPNDAEALGITTIYQDLALCDNLDIVQNMFLGHEPAAVGPARRVRHGTGGPQDAGRSPRDDRPVPPSPIGGSLESISMSALSTPMPEGREDMLHRLHFHVARGQGRGAFHGFDVGTVGVYDGFVSGRSSRLNL